MTYAQYLRESQRLQRAYIRKEQSRMAWADKLWLHYKAAMQKLDLHPLTSTEIADRRRQLDSMLARVAETHGDTPGQRAIYEARYAEVAL